MARKRKDHADETQLQNPEFWESESTLHQPSKERRAIVSVAFTRDDFRKVANTASAMGKKTSEFIREAALSIADGPNSFSMSLVLAGFSGDGGTILIGADEYQEQTRATEPKHQEVEFAA